MKVFVSQLFHEASSFVPHHVNLKDFKTRHYLKGYETVKNRFKNDIDWVSGALSPWIEAGDDINIGVCTACNPGGLLEYDSFMAIIRDMIEEYHIYLKEFGPPDVLMLLLHGANLVDGLKDPDGYLLEQFKLAHGVCSTVIGITLDFHANISEKLVRLSDIVIPGILYPHTDTYDRGRIASKLVRQKVNEQNKVKSFRFSIPILTGLPNQATVGDLPFRKLIDMVETTRVKYGIVDLCIAGGFAFGDCYDVGMCLIATNETYQHCFEAYKEISEYVWAIKHDLLREVPLLDNVWRDVESKSKLGRVVVADVSDSPGSGGNADETHVLSKLITSTSDFVSAFHVDPAVVQQAKEVGVGKEYEFTFGTSLSHPKSKILKVRAKVNKFVEYEYTNIGTMMHGAKLYGGPTAILEVSNGLIIVTTQRIQAYDINAFIGLGIDIRIPKPLIIAIKSTAHFRASYTDLADQGIILARGYGWSDIGFESFDYKYRQRPLLPLDDLNKQKWDEITHSYKID